MTLDEKLEHFYSSVIESATKQNIEIVEEYKKSLQKNLEERREAALRKVEANYRMASEEIVRERNRKLSAQSMDIRRRVLEKTEEIENRIFTDVSARLQEFMNTPEYDELLAARIRQASDFAQEDALTVYLNTSDASKKTELEARTGISLTVSDRDFIGGIRAVITARSILIDYSFLTKLEEAKSSFTL